MTVALSSGPVVNGPVPQPPIYTLVAAAELVIDGDEHWLQGVAVRGFSCDVPHTWSYCDNGAGSGQEVKVTAGVTQNPVFDSFTVYYGEVCGATGMVREDRLQRAETVLQAVEAYAVEKAFWNGQTDSQTAATNPSPADSTGTFVSGSKKPIDALAQLEDLIATWGRRGVIHTTPSVATHWKSQNLLERVGGREPGQNDRLVTINGTIVVPGYGYVEGDSPSGQAAAGAAQSWAVATGPVQIRRTPDYERIDALDRATNDFEFYIERHYAVTYDACMKAGVLIDKPATA